MFLHMPDGKKTISYTPFFLKKQLGNASAPLRDTKLREMLFSKQVTQEFPTWQQRTIPSQQLYRRLKSQQARREQASRGLPEKHHTHTHTQKNWEPSLTLFENLGVNKQYLNRTGSKKKKKEFVNMLYKKVKSQYTA